MKEKFLFAGALALVASSLLLYNCSGGRSGTSAVPSVSKGVITGFGSVFVNGIEYNSSGSSVMRESQSVSESELKVGMVVVVKGESDDSNGSGSAAEIDYNDILKGPISAISGTTSFTVLGQTVDVNSSTKYELTTGLTGTNPLATNDVVEVSGFPENNGNILATYVESKVTGTTPYEIKGFVSALTNTTKTFTLTILPPPSTLNAVTVNYSGTSLPGGVANGSFVDVQTNADISGNTITATSVEVEDELGASEGEHAEVEGLVTNLSGSTFTVSGVNVNAANAVVSGGTITANARVEVEGTFSGGVLAASTVMIK